MIETNNTAAVPSDLDAEIERRVADRRRQREADERAQIEAEVRAQAEREAQLQRAIEQRDDVIRRRDAAQAEVDALGVETSKLKAKFEGAWQSLAAKSLELTSLHGSVAASEATIKRLIPDPIRDLSRPKLPLAEIKAAIDQIESDENGAFRFYGQPVAAKSFPIVEAVSRAIGKLKGDARREIEEYINTRQIARGPRTVDRR